MTLPTAPRFGRTDPLTSADAADRHRRSGRLGADQEWVLSLVRGRPGSTCPELARYATYDADEKVRQRIGRRLSELLDHGLIYRNGTRDGCALWFPVVDPGPEQGALFEEPDRPFRIGD